MLWSGYAMLYIDIDLISILHHSHEYFTYMAAESGRKPDSGSWSDLRIHLIFLIIKKTCSFSFHSKRKLICNMLN